MDHACHQRCSTVHGEAFTAAGRRQPESALRHARGILAHADALGISSDSSRWAWPLAARAAHELGDAVAVRELLALLNACQPGHLAPMLRAEGDDLVRARLAIGGGDPAATTFFAAAISCLRENSTPYHLAHGLLDHAGHLMRLTTPKPPGWHRRGPRHRPSPALPATAGPGECIVGARSTVPGLNRRGFLTAPAASRVPRRSHPPAPRRPVRAATTQITQFGMTWTIGKPIGIATHNGGSRAQPS